ncbi:MAG TPA: hypothetical protein VKW04_14905 [Planctomycetota bacterium]|nr:hypothetical protein [Planctomycetota bacterium]
MLFSIALALILAPGFAPPPASPGILGPPPTVLGVPWESGVRQDPAGSEPADYRARDAEAEAGPLPEFLGGGGGSLLPVETSKVLGTLLIIGLFVAVVILI